MDYTNGNMGRNLATLVDRFGGWSRGEEVGLGLWYTCLEGFPYMNILCPRMVTTRIQLSNVVLDFKQPSSSFNFQLIKMIVVQRCIFGGVFNFQPIKMIVVQRSIFEAGGAGMCTEVKDIMDTRVLICREVVVMAMVTPRVNGG